MARILIVDDDRAFREGMVETLADSLGHDVEEAPSGRQALDLLQQRPVDLVFLDLRMPGLDGLAVLRHLRGQQNGPQPLVVILTAYADSHNTIEAMKLGAFDHLTKPVGRDDLCHVLERALTRPQASATVPAAPDDDLIGASAPMREVHKLIGLAAASDVTVLITGETGTGKERVAQALHHHSARMAGPFVAVNCAAIPAELMESELFGHVRGAFTGAVDDRPGRFREAERGTLMLDEIGDMPLAMQAKILRVLQDHEIKPVGGTASARVDVRIVAATNRNLPAAVRDGRFREDLLYRLNVLQIVLPPLRARGPDILLLAEHFLQHASPAAPKRLSRTAAKALLDHDWPGNVRELENLMQRLSVLVRGPVIDGPDVGRIRDDSFRGVGLELDEVADLDFHAAIAKLERMLITRAIVSASGNRTEAARQLGINRQLLYMKIKEHKIDDV